MQSMNESSVLPNCALVVLPICQWTQLYFRHLSLVYIVLRSSRPVSVLRPSPKCWRRRIRNNKLIVGLEALPASQRTRSPFIPLPTSARHYRSMTANIPDLRRPRFHLPSTARRRPRPTPAQTHCSHNRTHDLLHRHHPHPHLS